MVCAAHQNYTLASGEGARSPLPNAPPSQQLCKIKGATVKNVCAAFCVTWYGHYHET